MAFVKICDELLDELNKRVCKFRDERQAIKDEIADYESQIQQLEAVIEETQLNINRCKAMISEDKEAYKNIGKEIAKLQVAKVAIREYKEK